MKITSEFWCGGYHEDTSRCMHHDNLLATKCANANGPHRRKIESIAHPHADAKPRATHWCGGYLTEHSGTSDGNPYRYLDLCMHVTRMQAQDCPRHIEPITLPAGTRRINIAPGVEHPQQRYEKPDSQWSPPAPILPADAIAALVAERGTVYGPPSRDFARMGKLWDIIAECPDPSARHALYMIAVKLCRLITTPTHADSWADIQGYGRCGAEVMAGKTP